MSCLYVPIFFPLCFPSGNSFSTGEINYWFEYCAKPAANISARFNVLPTRAEPAQPVPPKRPAHYLWAVLIARIYEVFPLQCPMCSGQMRLIAFVTEGTQIRKILHHIGVESEPPHISPARGPPLWDDCVAQVDDGVHTEPDCDLAAQPAPDYEVDQRINW